MQRRTLGNFAAAGTFVGGPLLPTGVAAWEGGHGGQGSPSPLRGALLLLEQRVHGPERRPWDTPRERLAVERRDGEHFLGR